MENDRNIHPKTKVMKTINLTHSRQTLPIFSLKNVKYILFYSFLLLLLSNSFSQVGTLRGKVIDMNTGKGLPIVNIQLLHDSLVIGGAVTDFDGNYVFVSIRPGKYTLKANFVGYEKFEKRGIKVLSDTIIFYDVKMKASVQMLEEVVISSYSIPLIDKDQTVSGSWVSSQNIKKNPNRNANSIASSVGGLFSKGRSKGNTRGSRSNQNVVYIDGVRVENGSNLPQSAIQQTPLNISQNSSETKSGPTYNNTIQPGLLTAGEINDFSKWELWKDISGDELEKYKELWGIKPENRFCVQVMNEESFPVVGATVTLLNEHDNLFWTSQTDNTGKAEVWAYLFDSTNLEKKKFKISVEHNHQIQIVNKPKSFQKGLNTVVLEGECSRPTKVDILFTVDATGSMGDEIEYLKAEISDIIQKYISSNPQMDIRLGSVFYRCFRNSYVTKKYNFSDNLSQFVNFINEQSGDEGGMEAVEEALRVSVDEMEWNEHSLKVMFLVLDESPGNLPSIKQKMQQAITNASAKGIRIIPVVASGTNYKADKSLEYLMRSIALASNGTYVFLTDDSGIGNKHTKPSIDDYQMESLNDLIARLLNQYTHLENCEMETENKDPHYVDSNPKPSDTVDIIENLNKNGEEELIQNQNNKGKIWVKAYPNPTSGWITLEYGKKVEEVYIVDITGKIVKRVGDLSHEKTKISLSGLPNGMYFLKYANVDHWEYFKVILSH